MNNGLRLAMVVTTCVAAAAPALAASTFCGRQMTPRLEVLGYESSKPVPHFPTLAIAATTLFVSKEGYHFLGRSAQKVVLVKRSAIGAAAA